MSIIDLYGGDVFDFESFGDHRFDLLAVSRALANTCRFGGHCDRFYSVAEHCLRMASAATEAGRVHVLLHDLGEAYIGDIVGPLKDMFPEIGMLEEQILRCAYRQLRVAWPTADETREVRGLDKRMYVAERQIIMPGAVPRHDLPLALQFSPTEASTFGWSPEKAAAQYHAALLEELRCYRERQGAGS